MKGERGFTLVELLVVIAIIAVLMAILFPVFVQAKIAGFKAATITQQRQIGLAILMYTADSDDVYPRNDGCEPKASLNTAHWTKPFVANGAGCMGPFYNRTNHYKWQGWALPYAGDRALFEVPGRQRFRDAFETDGEIFNGFALNLGLTGRLNNYTYTPAANRSSDRSWLGGMQTAIPEPAQTMLLFEFGHPTVNFAPVLHEEAQTSFEKTIYPTAIREWWAYILLKWKDPTNCSEGVTNEPDPRSVTDGGMVIGFTDGHSRFLRVQAFLAKTPKAAEYGVTIPHDRRCGRARGNFITDDKPNLKLNYPLWGLTAE